MKPQKQLFKHDSENGRYGDCHRTCIAALLDKNAEEVPNFAEDLPDDDTVFFWKRVDEYLKTQGLANVSFVFKNTISEVLKYMGAVNPEMYYIMGVVSRGGQHSIICYEDEMICDPDDHPGGIEAMKTDVDSQVWIHLLVPIGMFRR